MICIIEEFVALLECREVSSTTGQFTILLGNGKGRTALLCVHSCALLSSQDIVLEYASQAFGVMIEKNS